MKIEDLYLSIEKQVANNFDPAGENTDVIVQMNNDKKYIASFFTHNGIEKLNAEHRKTGDFLSGKYFRSDNMILIENCSKESIKEVVQDLIDEGEFFLVFKRISK